MRDTVSSMSCTLTVLLRLLPLRRALYAAPASSITSMALSGRWRPVRWRTLSVTAASRLGAGYFTP